MSEQVHDENSCNRESRPFRRFFKSCFGNRLMSISSPLSQIYLSYVHSDEGYAKRFAELLEPLSIVTNSIRDAEVNCHTEVDAESILSQCSLFVVLIGPKTRDSRWVDIEIALATRRRRAGLPGGLLGIILPEHPDHSMPYYEAENIPVRLHDRVRWEYAVIRKWVDDPVLLQSWMIDAERRRRHFRPEPNYATLQTLKTWSWDENADTPRPALQKLWEQEQ